MDRYEMLRKVEEHYTSFWTGQVDDFDHQLAPDFVDEESPDGHPGPESVKEVARVASAAFPDMTVTLDQAVVEGTVAAVEATWKGSHLGPFMGAEPTGRQVEFQAIVIWRFDDQGRIVRRSAHIDRSALATVLSPA